MLDIYNVSGQQLRSLVQEGQDAGEHVAIWDAQDNNGRPVSSGIYIYRLIGDGGTFSATQRMVLLK